MKNYHLIKTIQLILFIALTITGLCVIYLDPELFHLIGSDSRVKLLCGLLWGTLLLSFLFLFMDFSKYASIKKEYHELTRALHSDPVSGIANRYSCDILIEKYQNQPLPDNIGCIMLELTNIMDINKLYGHDRGNQLIKDFSNILKLTSVNLCFVGRNGGNKFLAIFEDSSHENMDLFLSRVEQKVGSYNENANNQPLQYQYGQSFSATDSVKHISELIALADNRLPRN